MRSTSQRPSLHRPGTRAGLLCALLIPLGGCTKAPTAYEIWFGSGRSGAGDILRLRTAPRELATTVGHARPDFNPRWDAARLRIVFLRESENGIELHALDATGTHRLGASPADEEAPDWAPDGSAYVYATERDGNRDLFLFDIQSGRTTRLTKDPAADRQPVWSPDSQWIAFVSERTGNQDIWLIGREGLGLRNVTASPGHEGHPSWAPNGNQILFDGQESAAGEPDIFLLDLNTRVRTNLTRTPGVDLVARFSPDGAWIAFGSRRSGDWEIYRMRPDGSNLQSLTDSKGFDGDPVFVPLDLAADLPPRSP